MAAAQDPSQLIHRELLPHLHLLSTFRYPTSARIDPQDANRWLLAAPSVASDKAPFFWTYLEAPKDGQIFLTWQPTHVVGTDFATDGYVWPAAETCYSQRNNNSGLTLEIYCHRAGFRPPEPYAAHSRRRFRLVPPKNPGPNTPQVDPNLFIVHYGPSENNDRIPSHMIPVDPRTQQLLNHRQHLLHLGQIMRKDFMLSDRVNWPQIPLPSRGQAMYQSPAPSRGVPQQMAYPAHANAHPGPAKGRRAAQPVPHHHPSAMVPGVPGFESAFDDEEDTSRGDMFDHLTPREVCMARYQQNHEWMEEVLSSPYRMGALVPPDLGLGRKGELASLTRGIFEGQGAEAVDHGPKKPYLGRLDPKLADEFRKRVQDKIASTNDEIAQMKAQHQAVMDKLKSLTFLQKAEQELRFSVQGTGHEIWRLEGRRDDSGEDGSNSSREINKANLKEIVAQVESRLGKTVVPRSYTHLVQAGGYQENVSGIQLVTNNAPVTSQASADGAPAAESTMPPSSRQPSQIDSQKSVLMATNSDIEMGGTAASLLDQLNPAGLSYNSTPQPHVFGAPSAAGTPANLQSSSGHLLPPSASQPPLLASALSTILDDTTMGGTEESTTTGAACQAASDVDSAIAEWVMVPRQGGEPQPNASRAHTASHNSGATLNLPPAPSSAPAAVVAGPSPNPTDPINAHLPASGAPAASHEAMAGPGLVGDATFDQDFGATLPSDLNTAGDVLDGFVHNAGMDMNSAFDNAFSTDGTD